MSRVLHRTLRSLPERAVGGEGVYLIAADGRRIMDGSGGAAVACLGHGHPQVVAAMKAQADKLSYAHTGFFTTDSAEELAELILAGEPGGLSHAYFCSSGSEGVEAALKLARQYFVEVGQPQRTRYIARLQSYHGNTLGALGLGGNMMRRKMYAPILADAFSHVSPAFAYRFQRDDETEAAFVQRLADELEAEFQRLGPQNVIAFCAEPVVGATAGCVTAPAGYFKAMREVCDRHGALLILDEVMCGMGRTGTMHAWEREGVVPDLQVIAKGLGGGYQPIGGVLVSAKVIDALRKGSGAFMHGHTYQAHPMACAAALAVQKVIREDNLLENVRAMGALLEEKMNDRFGNHAYVGNVRGRGLFWAIELVQDRTSKAVFDPAIKLNDKIKQEAFDRGLACYPMGGTIDGARGDHVILAPPYISTSDEIERMVAILGDAVEAALPR